MTVGNEILLSGSPEQLQDDFLHIFTEKSCFGQDLTQEQIAKHKRLFLTQAQSFFVLILHGQSLVARAAIFVSHADPTRAYLGFYEVKDLPDRKRIAHRLINAAMQWASEKGISKVYGPIDLSTWHNYRIRTDENAFAFSWEPKLQPQLLQDWQEFGFTLDKKFVSYCYQKRFFFSMRMAALVFSPSYRKARLRGLKIEPMAKTWQENLQDIYRLAIDAFSESHLFEKICYDEFHQLYAHFDTQKDLSPSFFLVDPSGNRIGFILAFFDQNHLIIKTVGIASTWQRQGLSRSLLYASLQAAAKAGIQQGVAALVRDGNRSELMQKPLQKFRILKWMHQYQLLVYHKPCKAKEIEDQNCGASCKKSP